MKGLVLTNGNWPDKAMLEEEAANANIIICADGGARYAQKYNVVPDYIIGDLDSISTEAFQYFQNKKVNFIRYPKEKDETDTQLAVDMALKKEVSNITILGGIGSRLDHSIGNILLLVRIAQAGVQGKILDQHNEVYAANKSFSITGKEGELLSILPLGENVRISKTEGLFYSIKDQNVPINYPYGVSNVFTKDRATIYIDSGWIIIIKARD